MQKKKKKVRPVQGPKSQMFLIYVLYTGINAWKKTQSQFQLELKIKIASISWVLTMCLNYAKRLSV